MSYSNKDTINMIVDIKNYIEEIDIIHDFFGNKGAKKILEDYEELSPESKQELIDNMQSPLPDDVNKELAKICKIIRD